MELNDMLLQCVKHGWQVSFQADSYTTPAEGFVHAVCCRLTREDSTEEGKGLGRTAAVALFEALLNIK